MFFPAVYTMSEQSHRQQIPHGRLLEQAFDFAFTGKKSRLPDRMAMLGIPEEELTEPVRLAISALFERLDDTALALTQTQVQLKELESLVDVDVLAPIPNRRAFVRRLAWAVSMLERYGHPTTILYFDLNGFKEINDTFGHAAGDAAIRHVSELLSNAKRESDFMARLGGDEFAVILYYAEEEAARRRGEAIAEVIRTTPVTFNGQMLALDTAYGVHALSKGESADDALHAADRAMYADKRARRREMV